MEELFNFGLQGLVAFGVVGLITHFRKDLTFEIKVGLLVAVAFAVGFVPADLGNEIFNRLKEAVAIALGVHALWSGVRQIGK